jgi:hypothetical protein
MKATIKNDERMSLRSVLRVVPGLVFLVTAMAMGAAHVVPAFGETARAAWSIRSIAMPTNFAPGDASGHDVYRVLATDVGSLPANKGAITIGDTVDAADGLSVQGVELHWWGFPGRFGGQNVNLGFFCTTTPTQCTLPASFIESFGFEPDDTLEMTIEVAVSTSASGVAENMARVDGGGATEASTDEQTPIATAPATFEINDFGLGADGVDGTSYTQAGGHPYAMTTTVDYATQTMVKEPAFHVPDENVKDVVVDLPLGMVGNPQATPRCPLSDLEPDETGLAARCPADTKIGEVVLGEPAGFVSSKFTAFTGNNVTPLYNLVPEKGHAAEFGFIYAGSVAAHIYASVVSGAGGYVVRVTTPNISSEFIPGAIGYVTGFSLTLFGDPAKRDASGFEAPFFSEPTTCTGRDLRATVHVDTWSHQGRVKADGTPDFGDPNWLEAETSLPATTGCDALSFKPTIGVQADTSQADSPAGLSVDLSVPQAPQSDSVPATPDLRDAVVTLPAGMTVSPAAADGVESCSETQLGMEGGVPDNAQPRCPERSKIGTVELETPLLEKPLGGSVYLAAQEANPFKSLLALYVVIDDPATGVLMKLPGEVRLNQQTGQMTATFNNNPQLPFSDLKVRLKGGPRAPVVTPVACGTYTTTTSLTPWSAPDSGPSATASDSLRVTTGQGGTECGPRGFSPRLTAGTVDNRAGGFSPFTLTLTRQDADQTFSTVATELPPGLAGIIANVPLCGEADANAGGCQPASQIGHVIVQTGVGSDPLTLPEPGKPQDPVYLTGPYKGAPFGLSIVVPAEAGPFNLDEGGRPVVVRAGIYIDPKTARARIASDPIPTMLRGIPLDVKTVDVTIDRPEFIFNPTSCEPMAVGGTITSTQGATASVSSRFQAAECRSLPFKPGFSVLTHAQHSKANGEYLHVVVTSGSGEANIKRVHVAVPKTLPARLSTLNQACTESVFKSNPASCPAGSFVGTATAHTPVLPVPLTGPAIFVSHGGAAFPDLDLVLQGDGVTLILTGNTFINKAGVTTSTFASVPDVPVTRFDLVLPAGPHSALTASGDLCASRLTMPTTITGQNGAVVKQSTRIGVLGCKPALRVTRHKAEGATAIIVASVPSAGKLVASGKGLSLATATLGKAGTATLRLTLSANERRFLVHHPGRRLKVHAKLRFTPAHGGRLSASVTLLMG